MRSLVKHGLLLIVCLTLVGLLVALFMGAVWLIVRAPQLLILGGVLLVVCWILGMLAGNIGSKRQR